MTKKRILVVNDAREFGGAEESVVRLFRYFQSDEFELLLLCAPDSALAERFREDPRLRTGRFPRFRVSWFPLAGRKVTNPLTIVVNGLRLLQAVRAVRCACRRDNIDIVFSTNDPSHFYSGPAARLSRAASVWWLSNIIPRTQFFGAIFALFNVFQKLFCDRIVCISHAVKNSLKNKSKAEVVWYPTRELPETFPERSTCLSEYGLERLEKNLLVGMACRLVLWKGIQVLIEAAPAVLADFPQARFLILGDSPHEDHKRLLKEKVRALGLEERFIFHGFVENPLELVNCLDVCVHASVVPEPFGLTVLDYMQMGKAIVAAREGGIGEMLDEDAAVLVPAGDSALLADGIRGLLKSRELRLRLGERARERAQERFSPRLFSNNLAVQFRAVGEK